MNFRFRSSEEGGCGGRKCPGVRARRSVGSLDSGERGLEFRQASMRLNRVANSSKVSRVLEAVMRMWVLKLLTPACHRPPMWGAPGGIKTQLKPFVPYFPHVRDDIEACRRLKSLCRRAWAPTKLVPCPRRLSYVNLVLRQTEQMLWEILGKRGR